MGLAANRGSASLARIGAARNARYSWVLGERDAETRSLKSLTIRSRLSTSRGFWLFLVLLVAVPLLQLHVAGVASERLSGANPYLSITAILRVRAGTDHWPGVEEGDRLVAVNGRAIETAPDWWDAMVALQPGPATMRFERDGRRFDVTTDLEPHDRGIVAAMWFRYAVGSLCMLIGLAAFAMRPGAKVSWLFTLYCLALGVLVELVFLSRDSRIGFATQWWLLPIGSSLGLHLFTVFPRPIPAFERSRVRTALLYVPALILASLAMPMLFTDGFWRDVALVAEQAIWFWLAIGAVGGVAMVVRQYLRVKRQRDHEAVTLYRIIMVALIGLVVPCVLIFAIQGLHVFWNQPWIWHLSVGGTVVFAAGTGYALIKHNALGADRFTAAVMGYAVTTALAALAFGVAILGLPYLVGQSGISHSPVFYITLTVILTVSFRPLYQQVRKRIDRWYLREQLDAEQSMELLRELTQSMQGKDRDDAVSQALGALTHVSPDAVGLWIADDTGASFVAAGASAPPIPRDSALVAALKQGDAGGVKHLAPRELAEAAQQELWTLGLAMVAPISAHGMLLGFLGVGRKQSGTVYRSSELVFLGAVATQISIVLTRPTDGTQFGRYRIDRRLGIGGIAEVFLAWQTGPGGFERKVALKRPLPYLVEDPQCAAMFLDEARIASQLQHRNVVRVYEIDKHDGAYYIAMEYIDGPSLRTLIRAAWSRHVGVPVPVGVSIGAAILAALGHAHEQCDPNGRPLGVVHRDVTPSNVLLSSAGEVKLVDFGIARAGSQLHQTRTGQIRGTLPYMSPEQASGMPLDHRADLYSAAVVIYELLTGKRPFPEGPSATPPAPPSRHATIPAALDAVLLKALSRRPDHRYPSADAFRIALAQAIAPAPLATEAEIAAWMRSVPPDREPREAIADAVATKVDRPPATVETARTPT